MTEHFRRNAAMITGDKHSYPHLTDTKFERLITYPSHSYLQLSLLCSSTIFLPSSTATVPAEPESDANHIRWCHYSDCNSELANTLPVEDFNTTPIIPLFGMVTIYLQFLFLFGLSGAMHYASTVITVSSMNDHLPFILIDTPTATSVHIHVLRCKPYLTLPIVILLTIP